MVRSVVVKFGPRIELGDTLFHTGNDVTNYFRFLEIEFEVGSKVCAKTVGAIAMIVSALNSASVAEG